VSNTATAVEAVLYMALLDGFDSAERETTRDEEEGTSET